VSPSALRYRPRKNAPIRNRSLLFLGISPDSEVNVQPGPPAVPICAARLLHHAPHHVPSSAGGALAGANSGAWNGNFIAPSTFSMDSGSWIAASNRRGPPQRGHVRTSTAYTRRSNSAHV
jgi:hypothetical protein